MQRCRKLRMGGLVQFHTAVHPLQHDCAGRIGFKAQAASVGDKIAFALALSRSSSVANSTRLFPVFMRLTPIAGDIVNPAGTSGYQVPRRPVCEGSARKGAVTECVVSMLG